MVLFGRRVEFAAACLLALCLSLPLGASSRSGVEPEPRPVVETDTLVFEENVTELPEFVVKPRKAKYSKKNNPAVELMEKVRRNRELGDPLGADSFSYRRYDKVLLGLADFHDGKLLNAGDGFMRSLLDTIGPDSLPVLNLSLKEKAVTVVHTSRPDATKEILRGERSAGVDQAFEQENISKMIYDVLREVDIYGNDITLMQQRFVSPLSAIGADYYKYFLTDSLTGPDGHRYYELTFAPHNPESFSFNGTLLVDSDDPTAFVREVDMRIPRAINLNFVHDLRIRQRFERDSLGNRLKVSDDLWAVFEIIPGTQKFHASRHSDYSGFSYSPTPALASFSLMEGGRLVFPYGHPLRLTDWERERPAPLRPSEVALGDALARMRSMKWFRYGEKALRILAVGYVGTSRDGLPSRFDIGPVNTMLSFSGVEGVRLRAGGMTTAALSRHWFFRGYAAYGTKDHRWKYRAEAEYSLTPKQRHSREFPMNGIRLTSEYDLDQLGQHYLFTNSDNIFLSPKRLQSELATYRLLNKLEYNLELPSNLSLNVSASLKRQQATRWVPFVTGDGQRLDHLDQPTLSLTLRYAPGEVFAQSRSNRASINMDAPVLTLTHEYGPKALLGAHYTLNKTEASVFKRVWFSSFGYVDAIIKGGAVWSRVPYPELPWANANLSYTIQPESYTLMNPMEFAMDRYASVDLTYWMQGLLFNRLPLLKRLKLREALTFKALWGELGRKNDPTVNPGLLRFPEQPGDFPICRRMESGPYMELGVGLDNILRILRVDYVWRLSYRHTPGAPDGGLRVSLHFSF